MSRLRSVATALAVLLIATPLIAQSSTTTPDTTVRGAPAASSWVMPPVAMIDRAPSGGAGATATWMNAISIAPVKGLQPAAVRIESGSTPENKAMMIIGGSGLLVGAIVGGRAGTAFMVGGGLVGLIGLWNYLK